MVAQIKQSPNGSFKLTKLCESVVICESPKDPHGWGNETDFEPAFLVYLGCGEDEVKGYVRTFNTMYRCEWCEVRKPKYLKSFEAEIKIRGMQRESDTSAFGLDYLVESQINHENCINFDEYSYYTTGYMPD